MPDVLKLNELHTVIVGLIALGAGATLTSRVPFLKRLGLPVSVTGGVLVAVLVAMIRRFFDLEIDFATATRDALLLVFFTTVGLSAKLSALKKGGRRLAILCGVTVGLLVSQDLIGILIALARGAHPFYGLLIGSLSFVGGPGTAIAWAMEGQAMGLPLTTEVALGSATLATLAGALVAPLLTGLLIRRKGLYSEGKASGIPWIAEEEEDDGQVAKEVRQKYIALSLLMILSAVAVGNWLNHWASSHNVVLPGFLTAMVAGVLFANVADLLGEDLSLEPVEWGGALSLQIFLTLSLMGLQIWAVAPIIGPLMVNVALQVALAAAVSLVILFRLLGSDYDAAVTAGGFMGFGMASVPVAFATMEEVTARSGPSPQAFLLITLAASFFVDLANAVITKAFMMLPIFG